MISLIVHSLIANGNQLVHNVQCDNLARLKQVRHILLDAGYEVMNDLRSEGDMHTMDLWSLEDRPYATVPPARHRHILGLLRVPKNKVQVQQPHVVSTYAEVRTSRNMRNRRPSSPVRIGR